MGLNIFKKKNNEDGEDESIKEDEESIEEQKGLINKIKEYQDIKKNELRSKHFLEQHPAQQKRVIWINETGEAQIIGYPKHMVPLPNNEYLITYRKKSIGWLEEVIEDIINKIKNEAEQYDAVYVPKYCCKINHDNIVVYASSFRSEEYTVKRSIPIEGNNPLFQQFWEVEKKRADALQNILYKVMEHDMGGMIVRAMFINPALKSYDILRDKTGKGNKSKTKESTTGFEYSTVVGDILGRSAPKMNDEE
ncbi:hypothetical protein J3E07_001612 [Methanococcus voltae]|uniref:Uncharacterized protein n=1 Tax=Methanococcus voltae TaxID=2188 RepID=A0A8J7UV94_METVO|nr:hypothetical protein [Methanococcus voltae]MBP2202171.1 hypothetical protein [Methanococcus voltae]